MNTGWYVFSILFLIVPATATAIATDRISAGVAVFTFGFVLSIWADEIAGGDEKRKSAKNGKQSR